MNSENLTAADNQQERLEQSRILRDYMPNTFFRCEDIVRTTWRHVERSRNDFVAFTKVKALTDCRSLSGVAAGKLRKAIPSKKLLLHAVMHDDNVAYNGEAFACFRFKNSIKGRSSS